MSRSITLFSGLAVKKALGDGMLESFSSLTDVAVETVFEPTNVLLQLIAEGARPDVLIGVTPKLDELTRDGIIDHASVKSLAHTSVAVAAAPGVPLPDIETSESFIAALLGARSIAYSRTGASGVYFSELIQRLGIADPVNERATVMEKGFTALAVLDGRADLAIQQMSELIFIPEAIVVGPFPKEFAHATYFSVGLGRGSIGNPDARALLEYLTSTQAVSYFKGAGLEVS